MSALSPSTLVLARPRTPGSLVRAANYIRSFFEGAGLTVSEQDYDYLTSA